METRDVELTRFARKADGYKAALEAVPEARTLELVVTAAIIRGLFNARGWSLATTPIVDLMSGTGVVSEYLTAAGFGCVHSIEACHEMLPSSDKREKFSRNEIRTLADALPMIRDIKPGVIVSLAGFHHLIQHDGRRVDRFRSVLSQVKVIEEFTPLLKARGVFLIVDLVEPDAGADSRRLEPWDASVFRGATVLPESVKNSLIHTKTLEEYDRVVCEMLGNSKDNPTLSWFREVVDAETVLGHDDVALSNELLEVLRRHHQVQWGSFHCPWIFETESKLKFFLARKFGFLVDRKPVDLNLTDLIENARTYAGLHILENGRIAFGWNLAALLIQRDYDNGVKNHLKEINILFICIAILLVVRIATRLLYPSFLNSIEDQFDKTIFVFIGISVGAIYNWFVLRN